MSQNKPEWRVVLDMLEKVDIDLLNRIMRRMLYYLYTTTITEISDLAKELDPDHHHTDDSTRLYTNVPNPKADIAKLRSFAEKVFHIAEMNFDSEEITVRLNLWMAQERSRFLSIAAEKSNIPLVDIIDVLNRFLKIPKGESYLSSSEFLNIRVNLIRRFLSTNLKYINTAKHYLKVTTFHHLVQRVIGPAKGDGKLGGKSAGLILAYRIIERELRHNPELKGIALPRSWYLTSDTFHDFIHFNALEEVTSLKYMETEQVRAGYTYWQQLFKNCFFPPEIYHKLEVLVDKIGEKPIIVRSSSLLEDSFDASFSGKYKSLFLANSGPREERMTALLDAISEIFASTFGPDPIEYRKERGLLDFQEEMGILIQEVVGNRVGDYFFPTYAGVAFSHNEFRWSPRIEKDDGVVRIVTGLGTRAVDRVGDDYCFMAAPGKPGLRVNIDYRDIIKYSQKNIDVLNLKTSQFETLPVHQVFKEYAADIPGSNQVISIDKQGHLAPPVGILWESGDDDMVITFQNLAENSPFLSQMHVVLKTLKKAFNAPVDVEFASDGETLYILQCRPQGQLKSEKKVLLPSEAEARTRVFQVNKYITSGALTGIKHLVFVVPDAYTGLSSIEEMKRVALVISRLNRHFKKKEFILIGPGRWGSRGDIKLGVQVAYSDINNTAMLIELAYSKDGYVPDLSFGTHFFQDLVEADIKYLPIYPDEENNYFNLELFQTAENQLLKLLPDTAGMEHVVKVISLPHPDYGAGFTAIMDSDIQKGVGFIK
ncbi:MAG: pyruvate, phosphate dikinase [bacterium]|nr:pyruvate, phosphate dikinase [bacterium]